MTDQGKSIDDTLNSIENLYTTSLEEHGTASKGVGWKDATSHQLRFDKLAQVIDTSPNDPQSLSFNDWGCGYGAMFDYLDGLSAVDLTHFYGYDISDTMLEKANELVPDDRATFIKSPNVTQEADYSFVSGTFNVRFEATDDQWQEYIQETLLHLAKMSHRGIAFNLLTTYVDWKEDHLYYADPFHFFDFCKRNISRYVTLLHDYPLYEWTIYVRKDSSSS